MAYKYPLAELAAKARFRSEVQCPNCWHEFPLETIKWISVSPKYRGDPKLPSSLSGGEEQRRFVADRFTPDGRAYDPAEGLCDELACPRCHLYVPRTATEIPSITLSILGAPGSGKSVTLASMIYAMNRRAHEVGLRFRDDDLRSNILLNEDIGRLFADGAEFRDVKEAVGKTQTADAQRYRVSRIDGVECRFVPPFTFLVASNKTSASEEKSVSRLLCLYDNAGEHFRPGSDAADAPMTRHLAVSQGLIFTFDPTQHNEIRTSLRGKGIRLSGTSSGQAEILKEAANRIRRHGRGLSSDSMVSQPLVVAITKFDVWKPMLGSFEPRSELASVPGSTMKSLHLPSVRAMSKTCQAFLERHSPEIVSAAKGISDDVLYCPVAAIGLDVRENPANGAPQFRSETCVPYGVLTPLLYLLDKAERDFKISGRS